MDNKKIGLFISELRKDKNMTQKELADKLYVSDKAVSKWERGLSMPDIGLIEKLAEILGVNVSEILKGEIIEDMTKKRSDEIVSSSIPFFQKKYFRNKIIRIIISSIVILSVIIYIIGTIDYIRATNGKKPIFIYSIVNVSHKDVGKEGTEYYGIGYKISICDNETSSYIFQLGYKQKDFCYSNLKCSEKSNNHYYNFSFFNDKLYLINSTFIVPTSAIENEETWAKEALEYFDVVGIKTSIKKINNTTYEMKQTCNIPEMLMAGSKNVCSIDYFSEADMYDLTRTEIDDYYYKDACK